MCELVTVSEEWIHPSDRKIGVTEVKPWEGRWDMLIREPGNLPYDRYRILSGSRVIGRTA